VNKLRKKVKRKDLLLMLGLKQKLQKELHQRQVQRMLPIQIKVAHQAQRKATPWTAQKFVTFTQFNKV